MSGGVLSRILPARAQAEAPKLIADLDQLLPQPLAFKYRGHVYQLEIGTVRRLAKMADQWSKVMDLLARKTAGEEIADAQLYREYHKYISVLCPELSLSVVETMTYPMLRRLLSEIVRYASGEQDDEKKKIVTPAQS